MPERGKLGVRRESFGDRTRECTAYVPTPTPRLEDFPYRISDNVRYADLDPNQHVNNAVYATYFETGRVTLMKDHGHGLMPPGLSWMMVRLDMHFRAELRWPGTVEMGLGAGRSSDARR